MNFLNRVRELALLNRWWDGDQHELITLYGRRQVGKTELLIQFLADKSAIYFYADRQPLNDQLRAFTEQVATLSDDSVLRLQPFSSWESALTYVFRMARQRRIALVIDEFSYAVDADAALPSVLQRLWDTVRREEETKSYVVLCTSFTNTVERHFHIDGALYRRRTRELRVEPFTHRDAALFFPKWPRIERMAAWGVVGGVPSYLQALRGDNLGDAVIEHVLDKTSLLYREVDNLLAEEVRGIGPAILRGMLQAIAYGATEPNQIAQRVGRPVTGISGALGFLVDYGLLERRIPYDVRNPERTRRTRYVIADNYLAFWFRFILPNRSALERGQVEYVWNAKMRPEFDRYMGLRFERACKEFIRLEPQRWAHAPPELGAWWRASDELDIVGHDANTVVLTAEAKWSNERVGLDVLRTLRRRVALLQNVAPDHQFALFSKSGFTQDLESLRDPSVTLITLEDMLP